MRDYEWGAKAVGRYGKRMMADVVQMKSEDYLVMRV